MKLTKLLLLLFIGIKSYSQYNQVTSKDLTLWAGPSAQINLYNLIEGGVNAGVNYADIFEVSAFYQKAFSNDYYGVNGQITLSNWKYTYTQTGVFFKYGYSMGRRRMEPGIFVQWNGRHNDNIRHHIHFSIVGAFPAAGYTLKFGHFYPKQRQLIKIFPVN